MWSRNRLENAYRFENAGQMLLRWWGALFRAIFIAAVGFGGYLFFEPPSIADRPIAALTLADIGRNIFAWGLAFVCINWFFRFPSKDDGLSYGDWGVFGGYVAMGAILIAWLIIGNS